MMIETLPDVMLAEIVTATLREDLGRGGDITSQALIPADKMWNAALVARGEGVVAGLALARSAFTQMDEKALFTPRKADGDAVKTGDVLAEISGNARALLAAERTALNFLCHLSGIATLTRRYVEAVKPHKAKICCTRKTTPTLRFLEKYAVRAGGGANHRFGLDDAVLIKDNHIAVAGNVRSAVMKAREAVGHMVKIEAEVDTLDQLRTLLDAPVDVVMLDNMTPAQMTEAVATVAGRFTLEASGGVTLDTVGAIAATGVDVISVGALTHSAPILDIALDDAA
ncbi:MAG TPA: carboxylating nicotinate-nucleotide diphosphorylase [Rhodospirillaceae bacterium]|nr:carboxylating nicotinate-nucleotide diphosphorylase [Rhodospirillaceae bacterium]